MATSRKKLVVYLAEEEYDRLLQEQKLRELSSLSKTAIAIFTLHFNRAEMTLPQRIALVQEELEAIAKLLPRESDRRV